MSTQDRIRQYIEESILYEELESNDVSLVESGAVDSTGVMEIVNEVEIMFDVEIPPENLTPEHMDSVNKIAALVESLRANVAA